VFAPARKMPRTARSAAAIAAAASLALSLAAAAPAAAAPTVTAFDSLATIRSDRALPAGGSAAVRISAAGNEFESFQIAVLAGSAPLSGVRVDLGATLTGPGGATIPASGVTIYREAEYTVTQRSDNEGGAGRWPDALIPERDVFFGEDRSAFPVDLAAGGKVAAWVDVLVPDGAPAGEYNGSIRVSGGGGTLAEVPVRLTVHPFSIPSTSSLPSAFFADPWEICHAHTGAYHCKNDDADSWKLHALYIRAALENRMSIPNAFQFTYEDAPTSSAARPLFERYGVPLIRGTDPSLRLRGAKVTSVGANWDCAAAANGCLRDWKRLAADYGFSSRHFVYLCDEPYANAATWSRCAETAQRSNQVWPETRKLITTSIRDAQTKGGGSSGALRYTDLLTPPINYMIDGTSSQRPLYDSFLDPTTNAPGTAANELWLYTSCLSYSCNETEDPYWNGWPGYAIDQPGSQARAMGWLSFTYGATGELYWDIASSLSHAWTDQYQAGGNGDGNLLYPGSPGGAGGGPAIGGSHDIPIESLRMKRIRDGREDYEYLQMLARRGAGATAKDIARGLFGSDGRAARSATVDYAALSGARDALAAALGGAAGAGAPSGPKPKKPPRLKVLRVKVPSSPRQLRRRGVRALVRCTAACRVELQAAVNRTAARRLGVRKAPIAKGTKRLGANRRGWVTARLTPHARAKLRRSGETRFHLRTKLHSRALR